MGNRRVLHNSRRCLGQAARMTASSAEGDIPRGATAQVIQWFWRSSQFDLHLKSVARTKPVGVFRSDETL